MNKKMENKEPNQKIAIIRIRGEVGIKGDIEDTMQLLWLSRKNTCVVIPKNEKYLGMVNKIKDYVAWGEVDEATFNMLVEKRGEESRGREKDSKGNKEKIIWDKKLNQQH